MTVIVVYLKKIQTRTSQTFYKISLALSDIFTGIIIFPNFIFELAVLVWKPVDQSALSVTEVNRLFEDNNVTYKAISNVGGSFLSKFSTSYLNFLGFFTVITIAGSGYTLVIASGDRCFALYKPFSYHCYQQTKMQTVSITSIIVVWLLCCVLGIIPMVVSSFPYSINSSLLVTAVGNAAISLYVIAFVLPLFVLWILTAFAVYLITKYKKIRIKLTKNQRDSVDTDHRITRTLLIMVAIFSLNIIPILLLLVISLFLEGIYYKNLYLLPDNPSGAVAFNTIQLVAVRILLCNSLANVFVYSVRQKDFYDEMINWYKDIWKACRCFILVKRESSVENMWETTAKSSYSKT